MWCSCFLAVIILLYPLWANTAGIKVYVTYVLVCSYTAIIFTKVVKRPARPVRHIENMACVLAGNPDCLTMSFFFSLIKKTKESYRVRVTQSNFLKLQELGWFLKLDKHFVNGVNILIKTIKHETKLFLKQNNTEDNIKLTFKL